MLNRANKGYVLGFLSKNDQFAQTPDWLLTFYRNMFGSFYDPCPVNPKVDGLSIPWKHRNYVNPPYNELSKWIAKGIQEHKESIYLIPFRPHTSYFLNLPKQHIFFSINKISLSKDIQNLLISYLYVH